MSGFFAFLPSPPVLDALLFDGKYENEDGGVGIKMGSFFIEV